MVAAHQYPLCIDDELRVWNSFGRKLAHAQLSRHVVGRLQAPRLRDQHQPFPEREPCHLREDALLLVDRVEQRAVRQQHLGPPQEQVTVVIQRVMKSSQDLALHLGREVNERVAADQ